MQVDGFGLYFLDIPRELTQEYNRWYDLDHMPEHVAKADVLMGRRYVAPVALHDLPLNLESALTGGHAPYMTIYSFGGPVDMESEEAAEGWRALDHGIIRQGRFWKAGRAGGMIRCRLAAASTRAGCLVQDRAVPYLQHKGVIVAVGEAPTPEDHAAAIAWWDEVHLPDLLAVPGVLAALRGDPVDTADKRIVHVLLCDQAPAEVMDNLGEARRYAEAVGRYPAHKGVYEPLCFLPYDTIVPLQYDFEIP